MHMYNSDREEVEVQSCRVAREQHGCIISQKDILIISVFKALAKTNLGLMARCKNVMEHYMENLNTTRI